MPSRDHPAEIVDSRSRDADTARTTSLYVGRNEQLGPSSWKNPTVGLRSRGHDRRATETAHAEKALGGLRRWEWETETARETVQKIQSSVTAGFRSRLIGEGAEADATPVEGALAEPRAGEGRQRRAG